MTYMIKEFKPCPFCGRIWMIIDTYADLSYAVRCPCGAVGPVKENKQDAARAWNTRDQLLWNPFRFSIRFSKEMLSVDLKGKLDSLDFATILQMLASGDKTGLLHVVRGHTKSAICLKDGNIIAASDSNGLRLGQILYKNQMISHENLQNALRIAKKSNKMIGEVLLLKKYITPETLRQVIRQQVLEAVSELFLLKEGYFEYRDCLVEFDEQNALEFNTMEIILESAREADERDEQKYSPRIIIP